MPFDNSPVGILFKFFSIFLINLPFKSKIEISFTIKLLPKFMNKFSSIGFGNTFIDFESASLSIRSVWVVTVLNSGVDITNVHTLENEIQKVAFVKDNFSRSNSLSRTLKI